MSDETQQETVEGVITESPPVTENVSGQSDPALAESPPANPPVTEQPENKGSSIGRNYSLYGVCRGTPDIGAYCNDTQPITYGYTLKPKKRRN